MNSRVGIIVLSILFVVGVIGTLTYMSIGYHQFEVEICVTYKGRTNCGTGAGANRQEALMSSQRVACALISGGVTETIACDNTEPDSVRWISE